MRDLARIDKFCDELKQVWRQFPDWRFGQLMSNMLGQFVADTHQDIFFPEDPELFAYFRQYAGLASEAAGSRQ